MKYSNRLLSFLLSLAMLAGILSIGSVGTLAASADPLIWGPEDLKAAAKSGSVSLYTPQVVGMNTAPGGSGWYMTYGMYCPVVDANNNPLFQSGDTITMTVHAYAPEEDYVSDYFLQLSLVNDANSFFSKNISHTMYEEAQTQSHPEYDYKYKELSLSWIVPDGFNSTDSLRVGVRSFNQFTTNLYYIAISCNGTKIFEADGDEIFHSRHENEDFVSSVNAPATAAPVAVKAAATNFSGGGMLFENLGGKLEAGDYAAVITMSNRNLTEDADALVKFSITGLSSSINQTYTKTDFMNSFYKSATNSFDTVTIPFTLTCETTVGLNLTTMGASDVYISEIRILPRKENDAIAINEVIAVIGKVTEGNHQAAVFLIEKAEKAYQDFVDTYGQEDADVMIPSVKTLTIARTEYERIVKEIAERVVDAISAIGAVEEINADNVDAKQELVNAAEATVKELVYGEEILSHVTNYSKIAEAKAKIEEVRESMRLKKIADANGVSEAITAIGTVTQENYQAAGALIETAEKAYQDFVDTYSQEDADTMITGVEALTAARAEYNCIAAQKAKEAAIQKTMDIISAIGEADEITVGNYVAKQELVTAAEAAVQELADAYGEDILSNVTNYSKIADAKNKIEEIQEMIRTKKLLDAIEVTDAIAAIGMVTEENYQSAGTLIETAEKAYQDFVVTYGQKEANSLIVGAETMAAARAEYDRIVKELPARKEQAKQKVIDAITAIGTITEENYQSAGALIETAEKAYQDFVDTYGQAEADVMLTSVETLTAARADYDRIVARKAEEAKQAAIQKAIDAINAIGTVTQENYQSAGTLIETAEKAYQDFVDTYGQAEADVMLTSVETLTAARADYDRIVARKAEEAKQIAIQKVIDAINAIGAVEEINVDNHQTKQELVKAAETAAKELTDAYGEEILSSVTNYTTIVDAKAKIEEIILSIQYTLGDITSDSEINASDALMALQHSVKLVTLEGNSFAAADVDGNEVVDATDALYILQYSVKLIDVFPAQL